MISNPDPASFHSWLEGHDIKGALAICRYTYIGEDAGSYPRYAWKEVGPEETVRIIEAWLVSRAASGVQG